MNTHTKKMTSSLLPPVRVVSFKAIDTACIASDASRYAIDTWQGGYFRLDVYAMPMHYEQDLAGGENNQTLVI